MPGPCWKDDTFVVVNGKLITDLNLTAALREHRARNALATLVLRPTLSLSDSALLNLTMAWFRALPECLHERPGRQTIRP
jgi:ADP-glucose pyrophosphorylase